MKEEHQKQRAERSSTSGGRLRAEDQIMSASTHGNICGQIVYLYNC